MIKNKYGKKIPNKLFGTGTEFHQIGNIGIGCIKPEYKDCLEKAMEEWEKHKKTLPVGKIIMGKKYRPGVYAFAYWLIRWSGLVKPTNRE